MRKWDLTLHLQKHNGVPHNYDYEGCSFCADTKKQLKEHSKKHSDDHQHICTQCGKGFKYRSGLKRHRDRDHEWPETIIIPRKCISVHIRLLVV